MNHLINVMFLTSSLQVGGAEKLLVELMKNTAAQTGVHYSVVVINREINPELRRELEQAPCRVFYLNRQPGHKHPRYLYDLLRIIDRQGIRIVHTQNTGSKLWGVLCKLARPRLKLVVTAHDLLSVARLTPAQAWIQRHFIDMNIGVSRSVAAQFQAKSISNLIQIYNGIPLKDFEPLHLARQNWKPGRPLRILHVGRMDYPVKGQDILLNALHLCRQDGMKIHCRLVGSVSDENPHALKTLQAMAEDLDLAAQVEFILDKANVSAYLQEADLFVLPSRHEGLGLVILEAMAAGVPVIASNIEGPQELIRHGETGTLFESGNAESLFQAIRHLQHHPQEARQQAEAAGRFVRQFDIAVMRARYSQLYASLLNQPWATPAELEPPVTAVPV